jgi:hypothetical protein
MTKEQILKEYPYSTKIQAGYKVITPKENDKYLAKASLDSLKNLLNIPEEQVSNNPDLLYISADLWVGGMANKNDHAITVEDTIEMAKQIPHKYLNLEHDEERVVGSLFNYGFRSYSDEREFINIEDAKDQDEPLIASGGGFVWRSIEPKLSDLLIEAVDKNSDKFGMASFSWEVYFKDFAIMEGSKFVKDAIIYEEGDEFDKRVSSLKQKGGSGEYEGKRVYLLVKGPKLFLGAGIVKNPAADVKGVLTLNTDKLEAEKEIKAEENSKPLNGNDKKIKNNYKTISQIKNNNVKRNTAMKIKNLEDYKRVLASVGESEQVDAKTLANLEAFDLDAHVEKLTATKIGDAIREKSAEFAKEKEELENAKVKAAEDKAKVEAELSELKEKSEAADAELKELKEKLEAEEQSRVFSERMEALNSEYELGDDEAKVIAKNIKSLDEDAYGNWLEDFKVFAKEKSKDYKAKKKAEFDKMKKEKEDEDKDGDKSKEKDEDKSKASETDEQKEDAEKAIAAAQANANTSPANTQHEAVTNLSDKFKDLKLELAD